MGGGLLGFMLRGGGRYEGDWRGDNMTGRGIKTWADGKRYEGDYIDDKLHGHGIYTWANRSR